MKDDRSHLGHVLEAAERVLLYGQDGEERFRGDVRTQDAIIRNLQVMGEAVKKVSAETRGAHPKSPGGTSPGLRPCPAKRLAGVVPAASA